MGAGAGGHGNQTPNKGLHPPITWKFANAADRVAFIPSEGLPALASQLDADDLEKWALQEDTEVFYRLTGIGPVTWALILSVDLHAFRHEDGGVDELDVTTLGGFPGGGTTFLRDDGTFNAPTLGLHGSTHENGGSDEIDVTDLSGLLADGQTPLAHASSHETGGSDEIDVTDLAGLLADGQTPLSHASSHENGGSDEINVGGLSGLLADGQTPLGHASSHENGGSDEINVGGLSGLLADGQTPLTHASTHEDGGTDELDVTDLAGFPGGTADFLREDGAFAVPDLGDTLAFGNGSVSASTTPRYLTPSYESNTAPNAPIQYRLIRGGTLRNLRIRHNGTAGNGNLIVYTVRINSVATSITVSLASTSTDGSDLSNTAIVSAGDLIDVEITKAVGVGSSPSDVMGILEFTS